MKIGTRLGQAACVVGLMLPLAACGNGSSSNATTSAHTTVSGTGASSSSTPPASTASSSSTSKAVAPTAPVAPAAPATSTVTVQASTPAAVANPNVPSNAAPGAGGARPANATPLTERYVDPNYSYSQLAFKSPSGHNGCQADDNGYIRCGSEQAGQLFMDMNGQIDNGEPPADDTPMWPMPQTPTLAYGQVRYLGNTVFASTDQGVTVWNTQTGHGALINTSGVHQF